VSAWSNGLPTSISFAHQEKNGRRFCQRMRIVLPVTGFGALVPVSSVVYWTRPPRVAGWSSIQSTQALISR
jgi:hypothetical protein